MIFSKKNSKSTLKSGDSSRFVLCATTAMGVVTAVHDDDEYYALSSLFFTHRCFMFYVHTLICEKNFGGFHVRRKETSFPDAEKKINKRARVFCQKTKNADAEEEAKKNQHRKEVTFLTEERKKREPKKPSLVLSLGVGDRLFSLSKNKSSLITLSW